MEMVCHICGHGIECLLNKERICRPCYRVRWRKNRETRKKENRLCECSWSKDFRKQYHKEYREKNRERLNENRRKYTEKNRKQTIATYTLNNALKRGEVIKEPCIICGDVNSQAHHEDYNKPLEVIWLCMKHHTELHVEKRKNKN